jgi:hypothetical protein
VHVGVCPTTSITNRSHIGSYRIVALRRFTYSFTFRNITTGEEVTFDTINAAAREWCVHRNSVARLIKAPPLTLTCGGKQWQFVSKTMVLEPNHYVADKSDIRTILKDMFNRLPDLKSVTASCIRDIINEYGMQSPRSITAFFNEHNIPFHKKSGGIRVYREDILNDT